MTYAIWAYPLGSVILVSLIAFVSLALLSLRKAFLEKILLFFVSLAIGALLGDAFLHLLPEALEAGLEPRTFSLYALTGILLFFIIEKFLRWQHRHLFDYHEDSSKKELIKPYVWMNLFGDGIHNFLDGVVIAGSYLVSVPLGLTTTLAVILHEVPQELGDFGVLLQGGLTRGKALLLNFLSALTAVLGGVLTLLLGNRIGGISSFLVPFTFAGFAYIGMATLIPELHHEETFKKLTVQILGILIGIGAMGLLLLLE